MRVYLITLAELVSVPISEKAALLDAELKEYDKATGFWRPRLEGTLLECSARVVQQVREEIRFADDNIENEEAKNRRKQRAYSKRANMMHALFFDWKTSESQDWGGSAPGIFEAKILRHSVMVFGEFCSMSQSLPEPIKSRFSTPPSYEVGTDFPPDLSADSPVRAIDLPGWWVFHRKEIEALKRGYGSMDKHLLFNGRREWDELFEDHDKCPGYDFAFFEDDASW